MYVFSHQGISDIGQMVAFEPLPMIDFFTSTKFPIFALAFTSLNGLR